MNKLYKAKGAVRSRSNSIFLLTQNPYFNFLIFFKSYCLKSKVQSLSNLKYLLQFVMSNQSFCIKDNHETRAYYFCKKCAQDGKFGKQCFYCRRCQSKIHDYHNIHSSYLYNFQSNQFQELLRQYKTNLSVGWRVQLNELMRSNNKINNPTSHFYIMLAQNFQVKSLKQQDVRNQFLEHKFWEKDGGQIKTIIHNIVATNVSVSQKSEVDKSVNTFKFDWGQSSQEIIDPEKFSQEAEAQCKEHQKQLEILNVLIQVYASYSISDCKRCFSKLEDLIKRYPTQQILYYSLIRLYQLSGKNQQIPNVLKSLGKIDSQINRKAEYFYYQAMSEWRMIQNAQYQKMAKTDMKCLFYDSKNKMHYYINNVDKYLENIQKALAKETNDVFKAAFANGLLANKQNSQAEKILKEIKNPKDTELNNLNYSLVMKGQTINIDLNHLQHSRPFLINLARYFKKQKKYQQVVQICNKILMKEPKNQNMKMEKIWAFCKIGTQQAINQAELLIKDINKNKTKTLLLELSRAKGKIYWKNKMALKAINQFINVNNSVDSASGYYNLAASYYKEGNYSDADKSIKRCLQIKESQKALKLALYVSLRNGDIEEAQKTFNKIDDKQNKLVAFKDYFGKEA